MSLRAQYWRWRFAAWAPRPRRRGASSGYTLLLPVPGDLPVFLELALAVCRTQDAEHRVRTLVIPDRCTPTVQAVVQREKPHWPGPLELVRLPLLDRLVLPRLGDPGRNHAAQLITGVRRATGTHVLLHDADLFLLDPQVHAQEFAIAQQDDLDVLGIADAWDPWYAAQGRQLAATWEVCGRIAWFRSHPPHRHVAHRYDGHMFDTTFWPQLHTAPHRIAVAAELARRTVHLNYTISTYRNFVRSSAPFHDSAFRILFGRLLVELLDPGRPYGLPDLAELEAGLGAPGRRVHYLPADAAAYRQLRSDLTHVVTGPWAPTAAGDRCGALLGAFDAYFGLP